MCSCVLNAEWPKPTKLELNQISKFPAFSRPLVSTVARHTSAELTNEKQDSVRGGTAATSSRDFKVKSIDGLKLTVKTDSRLSFKLDSAKKRKRKLDSEPDSNEEPVLINKIKISKEVPIKMAVVKDSTNLKMNKVVKSENESDKKASNVQVLSLNHYINRVMRISLYRIN